MASITLQILSFILPPVVSSLAILNLFWDSPRPFYFLHSWTPYYCQKIYEIILLELHSHLKALFFSFGNMEFIFHWIPLISCRTLPAFALLTWIVAHLLEPPFPFLLSGGDGLQRYFSNYNGQSHPGSCLKCWIHVWCAWWYQWCIPYFEYYFK